MQLARSLNCIKYFKAGNFCIAKFIKNYLII